jgi:hypothetical protein
MTGERAGLDNSSLDWFGGATERDHQSDLFSVFFHTVSVVA